MTSGFRFLLPLVLLAALAGARPAAAVLTLTDVGGTFANPIFVAAPPGDGERLMVVLRDGSIRAVRNGATLPEPFLTVPDVDTSGEGGLLSMAFPPDYVTSGRFYVFMVRDDEDPGNPPHSPIEIREYRRTPTNPDLADPATKRTVLTIPHPDGLVHYGGTLQFGPDGLLYASVGDGLPQGNARDTGSLLGKLLRLDPLPFGSEPYRVPASNPFADGLGGAPLVYSYGLRNPFRFSFDRLNGDLAIGDVGEGKFEEIDFVPSGLGADFGWNICEGLVIYPTDTQPCTTGTLPAHIYPNPPDSCASVTGGVVVRDPGLEELDGKYVFGDYCATFLKSLELPATAETTLSVSVPAFRLTAFGEDACGRVHMVLFADPGKVQRLEDETPSPCNLRAIYPSPPSPPSPFSPSSPPAVQGAYDPPILRALAFKIGSALRQRPLPRGYVGVRLRCDGACSARALGRLSLRLKGRRIGLRQALGWRSAAGTLTLKLRVPAKARKTLDRALRRRRPVRAALAVRVRDVARKLSVRQRTVRLVR